ncbi:MAG TPA: hypothetical protein DCL88_05230 [Gammaproteobacteria bacterium]|nr:hypothetical protein [Gammaproteobacteria bacterium]
MIFGAILAPKVRPLSVHRPCLNTPENSDRAAYCQQIFDVLSVSLGQFFNSLRRLLREGSRNAENLIMIGKLTTKIKFHIFDIIVVFSNILPYFRARDVHTCWSRSPSIF